ncbi:MAG: hypothetical protein LQ346_006951 [Caloplaca aetnensis]|nr:MAG: hypothetical protein LQ346_006951 [Caloplaca aetnensis]
MIRLQFKGLIRIIDSSEFTNQLLNKLPSQADSVFSGISTFGRLPYFPCLASDAQKYDIAFIGTREPPPVLLQILTERGARFGPSGIRQDLPSASPGSRKSSYDNAYAIEQIEQGHAELLTRAPFTNAGKPGPSKAGLTLPRLITLGGDHTITLPLLRSVVAAYGPISVIHFDSHLYASLSSPTPSLS